MIKNRIILTIVVAALMMIIGFWQYQHQKHVNFCKDICIYTPSGETWKISSEAPGWTSGKIFYTEEELGETLTPYDQYLKEKSMSPEEKEKLYMSEISKTSKYFPNQEQCIDYCLRNK